MAFNQVTQRFPLLPATASITPPGVGAGQMKQQVPNMMPQPIMRPGISSRSTSNQAMNGFISNSVNPIPGKMQTPNFNQPHTPSGSEVPHLPIKSNPNYPQQSLLPQGSQGVRGSNSPAGAMTPTRPQIYERMSSSAIPTQVSANMSNIRQPSASYPNQASSNVSNNILNQSTAQPTTYGLAQTGISSGRRQYPSQLPPGIETPPIHGSIPSSQPQYHTQVQPNGLQPNQLHTPQTIPIQQNMHNQKMYQRSAQPNILETNQLMGRLTVEQSSTCPISLLEQKQIVPPQPLPPPLPPMSHEMLRKNVKPEIMRCTLNAVPQTSSLLKQCKLPFGIYIHPFKEDQNIPTVSSVITRCRSCRSYLNPFVSILDQRRWQCNICFRINDLPEELSYDYSNRQYIDVRKRPELSCASIEFIAPSEYMLRPPQASVFVFVLDVSYTAISTGYLQYACEQISQNIDTLPGDARTMVGFITFNSNVHFYSLKTSQAQPQMFVISDLEDLYLPVPDGLLVNVKENKDMILQLLGSLPTSFSTDYDSSACTGAAMVAAKKMVSTTGGRLTVFQTCLPSVGPGKLDHRDSSNMTANSKDVQNLNASTDFYKKFALECAGEQVAVDLFLLAGQYCDLASLSCASRYSSGSIHYFPEFHATKNPAMLEKFCEDFKHYLVRNIGFEAVMRLRCTKGLSIHTFHGNFFVRSTDLLSLPNVNPDHTFGMQISIEDPLTDTSSVGFQAALLYTTTTGERRIRVHTLSLPVTSKISDVYTYADQEAIIVALAKLAVDRTLTSSLGDAREALMNACVDCAKIYRNEISNQRNSQAVLMAHHLRMLPLHILALMKNDAFKLGGGVTIDQRVFSLLEYKWQPWQDLMLKVYPRLYSVLELVEDKHSGDSPVDPPILQASAENLSRQGVYLMDAGKILYLFVGRNVSSQIIQDLFHVESFNSLPENMYRLPVLQNKLNAEVRKFISKLRSSRPFFPILFVIREDTRNRLLFLNNLIDDRTESSMSYHEFLQHVQRQLNG